MQDKTKSAVAEGPSGLRGLARRFLPHALQIQLKKLYYPFILRRFREEQWPPSAFVRHLVKPGALVVDAGANVGYVSMLLSRWVGADGSVMSFEPVPETFRLLAHNVRHLRMTNVQTFNCGLSCADSHAVMDIPDYPDGGANLYESRIRNEGAHASGGRAVTVRLRALDSVLVEKPLIRPAFLKIDVEGHELAVLEGARATIAVSRPAMLIEIAGRENGARTFSLLAESGYSAYTWDGRRLHPCARPGPDFDYLFIQPEHAEVLATRDMM